MQRYDHGSLARRRLEQQRRRVEGQELGCGRLERELPRRLHPQQAQR